MRRSCCALADYQASPAQYPIFGILVLWLALFVGETWLSQKWRWFFPPYLVLQCALGQMRSLFAELLPESRWSRDTPQPRKPLRFLCLIPES